MNYFSIFKFVIGHHRFFVAILKTCNSVHKSNFFVFKKNSSDLRLSSRASRTATNQGIHLGELMEKIVHRLGGDGGGHAGAAGWSGTSDEVELKSVLLATLSSELIQ